MVSHQESKFSYVTSIHNFPKNKNNMLVSTNDPFYLQTSMNQFDLFIATKSRVLSNMDFLEFNSLISDDPNEILTSLMDIPKYIKKINDENKFLKINSNCFLVSSISESGNVIVNDSTYDWIYMKNIFNFY